jgi:hypothetical protein
VDKEYAWGGAGAPAAASPQSLQRECCLLVLNSVTSTPQNIIRSPDLGALRAGWVARRLGCDDPGPACEGA